MWSDGDLAEFKRATERLLNEAQYDANVDWDLAMADFKPNDSSLWLEEVLRFKKWLPMWEGPEQLTACMTTITITVVVPAFPVGSAVEFSGSAMLPVENEFGPKAEQEQKQINAAARTLLRQLMAAYKASGIAAQGAPEVKQKTEKKNSEEWLGTSVVVREENGKRYYRIRGGRWALHGVTVWPEVLEGAEIDPQNWHAGEYPLNRTVVCELRDDGKPSKITLIR